MRLLDNSHVYTQNSEPLNFNPRNHSNHEIMQCEPAIHLHMNVMVSSMDGIMHLYIYTYMYMVTLGVLYVFHSRSDSKRKDRKKQKKKSSSESRHKRARKRYAQCSNKIHDGVYRPHKNLILEASSDDCV